MNATYWDLKKLLNQYIYDETTLNDLEGNIVEYLMEAIHMDYPVSVVDVGKRKISILIDGTLHGNIMDLIRTQMNDVRVAVMKAFYLFIEDRYEDIRAITYKDSSYSGVNMVLMGLINDPSTTFNYYDIMTIPNVSDNKCEVLIQF